MDTADRKEEMRKDLIAQEKSLSILKCIFIQLKDFISNNTNISIFIQTVVTLYFNVSVLQCTDTLKY